MRRAGGERVVAVPLLGERSGGVGQVSSLIWRAVSETWPSQSALVELLDERRVAPSLGDKLEFGWAMGGRQLAGRARWILFAHLGLARVERFIPAAKRSPYAIFLHGVEAWRRLDAPDRELLCRAELRLANSAFTARRVREINPEVGPIEVCPLALADEPDGAAQAGDPGGGKVVLVVGRLSSGERYKGHEQLISAWPEVVASEPTARLMIVGDGDDRPRLEEVARRSRAADRIEFTGFLVRPDLEKRYREAAVFAMPSRNEGFGLVYLEAMAHGLPCIGSIHDAAGEVITHGETGLVINGDRSDEIAAAVIELLADDDRRARLGRAGHERWRTHFSYDRFQGRLVRLLSDAFEGAPAGLRPA